MLVAAITVSGSDGVWAIEAIEASRLAGPSIVRAETVNVLRRLGIAGLLPPSETDAAYRKVLKMPIEVYPFEPFAERVWQLRHNLTSYDAWYVAIAEALDCPLATLDRRLGRVRGLACEFLMPPDPVDR